MWAAWSSAQRCKADDLRHHRINAAGRQALLALALGLWAGVAALLWPAALAAAGSVTPVAAPPAAGLFGGLATVAAPDDPMRAMANPAAPAFIRGDRWGFSVTGIDGQAQASGARLFQHAAAYVRGWDPDGVAVTLTHGGREVTLGPPAPEGSLAPATELAAGYSYATRFAPDAAWGVTGRYRRVRVDQLPAAAGPGAAGQTGETHYLEADVGVLAALGYGVVVGATLGDLVQVGQAGARPAEAPPASVFHPRLDVGMAYQANPYLVLEADMVDLFDTHQRQSLRMEARIYPGLPMAVRLGVQQPTTGRGDVGGWLLGLGMAGPDGRWAISYTFLGPSLGGVHQVALTVLR